MDSGLAESIARGASSLVFGRYEGHGFALLVAEIDFFNS